MGHITSEITLFASFKGKLRRVGGRLSAWGLLHYSWAVVVDL
jgi:hypothetical protein